MPSLIDVLGYQGWDFLVFDGEHGTLIPGDCENMVRAAELQQVTPIVRVTTNEPSVILRFLDSGAQGALVPSVRSAEEAIAAVRSVKYYPSGIRGLAGVRAADYGQKKPLSEYVVEANNETLTVIQIETAEAVEHLEEIVSVVDVDVAFIGPMDLSQSYGVPGLPQHPRVLQAIDRIVQVTLQSKCALGVMVSDAASARQWRQRGAKFIATTFEAVLGPAMRSYLHDARA